MITRSGIDVIFPTPAIKTLLQETATKPMLLGALWDRWLAVRQLGLQNCVQPAG